MDPQTECGTTRLLYDRRTGFATSAQKHAIDGGVTRVLFLQLLLPRKEECDMAHKAIDRGLRYYHERSTEIWKMRGCPWAEDSQLFARRKRWFSSLAPLPARSISSERSGHPLPSWRTSNTQSRRAQSMATGRPCSLSTCMQACQIGAAPNRRAGHGATRARMGGFSLLMLSQRVLHCRQVSIGLSNGKEDGGKERGWG